MNYTNVTDPIWANTENTLINCKVTFDGIGTVPFTANLNDTEEHGRDIFAKAKAGEFGVIAKYVAPPMPPAPPQPTVSDLQAQLADISAKLQALQGASL